MADKHLPRLENSPITSWASDHFSKPVLGRTFYAEVHDLLTLHRFDLGSKSIRMISELSGLEKLSSQKLYAWHLQLLNNFAEQEPYKRGISDFETALQEVASMGQDILTNNVIPCDPDLIPIDGAHRLARADAEGIPVQVAVGDRHFQGIRVVDFTKSGWNRYSERTLLQNIRLNKRCAAFIVWPFAVSQTNIVDRLRSILFSLKSTIAERRFTVTDDTLPQLFGAAYFPSGPTEWMRPERGWKGLLEKIERAAGPFRDVHFFLLHETSSEILAAIKKTVRREFRVGWEGQDAIHSAHGRLEVAAIWGALISNGSNPTLDQLFSLYKTALIDPDRSTSRWPTAFVNNQLLSAVWQNQAAHSLNSAGELVNGVPLWHAWSADFAGSYVAGIPVYDRLP